MSTHFASSNFAVADEAFYGSGFGPDSSFITFDGEQEIFLEGQLPDGMHYTTLTKIRREAGFGSDVLYDGDESYEDYVNAQWGALWSMSPYHQARRILEGVDRADGTHVPGLFDRFEGLTLSGRLDLIVDVMQNLASLRAVDIVEEERFRDAIRNAVRDLHAQDPSLAAAYVERITAILPEPVVSTTVIGGEALAVSDPTPKLRRALDRIVNPEAYVVAPAAKKPSRRRRPGRGHTVTANANPVTGKAKPKAKRNNNRRRATRPARTGR